MSTTPTLLGIDIYGEDPHPVDWKALQASGEIGFVFLKASEALTSTDHQFASDWTTLGEIGLTRGAYHFVHADLDGAAQAQHFLNTVLAASGSTTLPAGAILVLDVETARDQSPAKVAATARHAADYLIAHTGRAPLLYTSLSFANENELGKTLHDLPLWMARYTSAADPGCPSGWSHVTLWQYAAGEGGPGTDAGGPAPLHPTGLKAPVDSNRFHGTHDEFLVACGVAKKPAS